MKHVGTMRPVAISALVALVLTGCDYGKSSVAADGTGVFSQTGAIAAIPSGGF